MQRTMLSKNQFKFVKSLLLKKNRKQLGLFVAEGPKVVGDLLRAGFTPHSLFSTEDHPKWQQVPCSIQLVTADELSRLSFLQHPQQVLAVFHIPDNTQSEYSSDSVPHTVPCRSIGSSLSLALDGIQDPGNLGTIIRIADWFGISTIYCSPDTADTYNPKVVQATMGSLAHVTIIYTDLPKLLQQATCPVYGTLLDGTNIYSQELTAEGIIVMGNEGNGISPKVRPLITKKNPYSEL